MTPRIAALLALLCLLGGCGHSGPPFSPKDALKTFKIEEGFRIEPYITEPEIRSPVAMEIDENGRIYVVEDPGYPLNVQGKVGRVILFDTLMGKGVPFLEQREKNHFIRVDPPEWQQAIEILDQSQTEGACSAPRSRARASRRTERFVGSLHEIPGGCRRRKPARDCPA